MWLCGLKFREQIKSLGIKILFLNFSSKLGSYWKMSSNIKRCTQVDSEQNIMCSLDFKLTAR